MQIRFRLTIQFILIAAGILLGAFVYIHFQFKQNLQDEFYDNLRSKALIISEMVVGQPTDSVKYFMEEPEESSTSLAGEFQENISIYNAMAQRVYSFNPSSAIVEPEILEQVKLHGELRFTLERHLALGLSYVNTVGDQFWVIAESRLDRTHIQNLSRILLVVFILCITLIAAGGWFFSRQALLPVSRIMNEVDSILPTDMRQRLVTSGQHDELGRLVITFNKLLDRIQQVFSAQKMFLSNISHELKNPLNVIISQLEVALNKRRSETEYHNTLQSVLVDVQSLNEVTDKLMQLARIHAEDTHIAFQPVRIDELVWQAKVQLVKAKPDFIVHFEITNLPAMEDKLFLQGNEQLLKTAIMNLMENGCKFSPDKTVEVRLSFPENNQPIIEIMDKGPGISEEEIDRVTQPFYRSTRTAKIKGSGIGLSLAESIFQAHHIRMEIRRGLEKGTRIVLHMAPDGGVGHPILHAPSGNGTKL